MPILWLWVVVVAVDDIMAKIITMAKVVAAVAEEDAVEVITNLPSHPLLLSN